MTNKSKILLILLFALLCPGLVLAYHVLTPINTTAFIPNVFISWEDTPVDFRVDGGTLAGDDGLELVDSACDEWNNVEDAMDICGNLNQISQDIDGSNVGSLVSANDGINDVIFDETGDVLAFFGFPSVGVLGVGFTVSNTSTGEITDALLILNGGVPSSPSADLLATTVHEYGHIWGLAHTPIGGTNNTSSPDLGLDPIDASAIPTMFFSTNPENDEFGRDLEQDDIAVFILQYPDS